MTTEEISKVIHRLYRRDTICGRYVDYQRQALEDIWNRTAGGVDYKQVVQKLKRYRTPQNKQPSFSPAMFVAFTLRECLEIFEDYAFKISLGSGFAYCGNPAEESEEDKRIRDNILRDHYDRPVVDIYASVYPKILIVRTDGDTRGSFWDQEGYDNWKERMK